MPTLSQAGRDAAIDVDQGKEMIGLRPCHQREGFAHHEYLEVGDVLPHPKRQRIVAVDHRVDEYRPEPAVIDERLVEADWLFVP